MATAEVEEPEIQDVDMVAVVGSSSHLVHPPI